MPSSPIASNKPTAAKLGIKTGYTVALVGAPPGFTRALRPRPPKVTFTALADRACDVVVAFVRSSRELSAQLSLLGNVLDRQTLWIAWPKKASGVSTDVNGNVVRETALSLGWVDFKICAIDATWSGLAFKKRARSSRARPSAS